MLRWITGAWVLILCGVGALLVSEFPLAELFGAGSLGYGLLISSWGAGTLIGSVFAARGVNSSTYWSLVAGTLGLSVMLGSVAIAPFLWIVCVTQLIGGIFDTFVNVAEETVRQQRTPDELRSRVFAAGEAIVVIAMSASIAVGGPLIQAAGPRAAYALTGVLGLLATVTIWWGAGSCTRSRSAARRAGQRGRRRTLRAASSRPPPTGARDGTTRAPRPGSRVTERGPRRRTVAGRDRLAQAQQLRVGRSPSPCCACGRAPGRPRSRRS